MPASIEVVWNFLVSLYSLLAGVSTRTSAQVRAYARGFLGIFLGMIALMGIAVVFDNKTLSIIMAIFSSLMVLVPFYLGRAGAKIADRLGSAENAKDLRALFNPLSTLSLIFAFIGTWVSIEGTGSFNTPEFWVALAVVFFLFVFMAYTQSEKKYAGYVMLAIVAFILFRYVAPESYRVFVRSFQSNKGYIYSELDRNARKRQADSIVTFATVETMGFVFDEDGLVARRTNKETGEEVPVVLAVGQKVLVMNIKADYHQPEGQDPMEDIALPDEFGAFTVLSPKFKFPKKMLGDYQTLSNLNKEIAPQAPPQTASAPAPASGKNLTITVKPDDPPYVLDEVGPGKHWRFISFNGAFSHRVNRGDGKACWKEVNNNLPWNADWEGKLEVKAGNTPVTLTVNIS